MAHPPLPVPDDDMAALRRCISDPMSAGGARRARIVVLAAKGLGTTAIAAELGCSPQTVAEWRERYRRFGLAGLVDAPRSGRPVTVDEQAVLRQLLRPPPTGARRWSSRSVGAVLGVSNVSVANTWRAVGVAPTDGGRVRLATRPPLDLGSVALAGIHVDASVRVLALRLGRGAPGPATDVEFWRDLRDALQTLIDDVGSCTDPDGLDGFGAAVVQSPPVTVVTDRATQPLPAGVITHEVGPPESWCRVAAVACLVASAGPDGVEPVAGLVDRLRRRRAGEAFSWVVDGFRPERPGQHFRR